MAGVQLLYILVYCVVLVELKEYQSTTGKLKIIKLNIRPSPLLMCVTYPGLGPTGYDYYTLDSTTSAWPQQEKFTLPRNLFSHLGFPECSCCLECSIVLGFVVIVDW